MLPKLILQHLYWIYMLKIVYSNSFLCLYFRVNNSTDHARYVHGKVSRMVGIICKIKKFLSLPVLKTIYYSLIYPHFMYSIIFWADVNKNKLQQLFRLQKKILRLITNEDYFAHSTPVFHKTVIFSF